METSTKITRRRLVQGVASSPAVAAWAALGGWTGSVSAAAREIKISHQFPGGNGTTGDFRDVVCRTFATELEKRSGSALKGMVYAGSSLMKTNAQFSAMRKGALDMSLVPLSYAGGEVPETNIGLMPGIVTSYEQAARWKTAAVGKALSDLLMDKGVVLVSWIWQAGGVASRVTPIVDPDNAKGLKVRGGSREMDMVLKKVGAAVLTLPSNEIYAAMQTGALDAAMTSSTSLISFRLEEVAKALTTGRGNTYWFMFEPLMMSRHVFDALSKEQQDLVMKLGADMEAIALKSAQLDDENVAGLYQKAGGKAYDMNAEVVKKWQNIARETAWKDFEGKNASCARILKLAEQTL